MRAEGRWYHVIMRILSHRRAFMAKKGTGRGLLAVLLTAVLTVMLGLVCFGAVTLLAGPRVQQTSVILQQTPAPDVVTLPPAATPVPEAAEPTSAPEAQEATPEVTPEPTPVPDSVITIRVVGDIMCHDRQLAGALRSDGSYEMEEWFDPIRESLSSADLTIGNLETSFAGEEEGYSGFPRFNSPDVYADALANAGFDVLTMANNHTYDFRAEGIERTMEVLDARGVQHTGAYAREEDFDVPLICEVGGLRVGVLAYTDTFNSKPKKDYSVRTLSREQVEKDVAAMKQGGADFILCVVHWGTEYEETPGSGQRRKAEMLAEAGVDAIFGSHPHVVQTAEMLTVEREDGVSTVPVAYSMGNFISNQQDRPHDIGVIFEIRLRKSGETGETALESAGYVPTVVYRWHEDHRDNYAVLPCGVYKEMDGHEKQRRCRKVWEWMEEEMGQGWEILEK